MSRRIVHCNGCMHYRPQASILDAFKEFNNVQVRKPVMDALRTVRQAETELLEQEAALLFELFKSEQADWSVRPRLAPFCAFGQGAIVASLKNRRHDCGDFKPAFSREARGCQTCAFVENPEAKLGDNNTDLTKVDDKWALHYADINEKQREASSLAQGIEIEQSFYTDGRPSVVKYLPSCSVRSSGSVDYSVPFCNIRRDCELHAPILDVPPAFLRKVEALSHMEPDDAATYTTLSLVEAAAKSFPGDPLRFMELAGGLKFGAGWARDCVRRRWLHEIKTIPEEARKSIEARSSATAGDEFGLIPVIAGCDAYEWGALAAASRRSEAGATWRAAIQIVQQVGDWYAATFHPRPRLLGVASLLAMLRSGVFAEGTVALVDPFMKRVHADVLTDWELMQRDLPLFLETYLLQLSRTVMYLRVRLDEERLSRARTSGLDLETVFDSLRAEVERARAGAKARAAQLIQVLDDLLDAPIPLDKAAHMINSIGESEFQQLKRDREWEAKMAWRGKEAAADAFAQSLGAFASNLPIGNIVGQVSKQNLTMAELQAKKQVDLQTVADLHPRHQRLVLLLGRGAAPASATASKILNRSVDALPESLKAAWHSPAGPSLEDHHVDTHPPSPASERYLSAIRRVSAPRLRIHST